MQYCSSYNEFVEKQEVAQLLTERSENPLFGNLHEFFDFFHAVALIFRQNSDIMKKISAADFVIYGRYFL